MLLKRADDKSKRLALLENLQSSPLLEFRQKKWLKEQLTNLRKGLQGEREADVGLLAPLYTMISGWFGESIDPKISYWFGTSLSTPPQSERRRS